MCLSIDTTLHPLFRTDGVSRKPRTCTRPILVWKRLEPLRGYDAKRYATTKNGACIGLSPYRQTPYYNGRVMTAQFSFRDSYYSANHDNVEAGLHAMTCKPLIERTGERSVPAIIPVGAKFYISDDGEIVSNQLIAYKDKPAMNSVHRHEGVITVSDAVAAIKRR